MAYEESEKERQFIAAYDRYHRPIFRYCYFRIYNQEEAHDLAQETFIRTFQYMNKFGSIGNIRAFLYRVAYNLCIDELTRPKACSLEVMRERSGFDPPDNKNPTLVEAAEIKFLKNKIDILSNSDQEVLMLRYVNGLPVKEIGFVLNEHPNTVSVRISRAKNRLKNIYNPLS